MCIVNGGQGMKYYSFAKIFIEIQFNKRPSFDLSRIMAITIVALCGDFQFPHRIIDTHIFAHYNSKYLVHSSLLDEFHPSP